MTKKRGKTPSLIIGSSGKPCKVTARRRRVCQRCSSDIFLGDICFEIPKVGGGFSNKKTFCLNYFKDVLTKTKEDIAQLDAEIIE